MDVFGGRPMLQAGALAAVMAVCGYCFNKTGKLALALLLLAAVIVCAFLLVRKSITPYRFFANVAVFLIGGGVLLSCFTYYDVGYLGSLRFVGEGREIECEIIDVKGAGAFYTNYEINIARIDGEECDVDALLECQYVAGLKRGDVAVFNNARIEDALAASLGYTSPLADGVFLEVFSEDGEGYTLIGSKEKSVFEQMTILNSKLSLRLEALIDGEAGALASAMLLGNTEKLSASTHRDFARTGVSHLLAISGLHFSIIASLIGTVLLGVGMGKGLRSAVLLLFMLFYLSLIGFPVSAVRAAIMLGITYISYFCGMSDDSLSSLGLAAWVILLISPAAILDVGFILSFCATMGILVVMPVFSDKFSSILQKNRLKLRLELEADPSRRGELNKRRKRFIAFVNLIKKIAAALVVSFAVWMLTLVPVWYSIGTMSLASVIANLLLCPAATAFIILSIFSLALGGIPFLGGIVVAGAEAVGEFILSLTSRVSLMERVMLSLRHDFVGPIVIASACLTLILLSIKLRHRLLAVLPSYVGLAIVVIGVLVYNNTADTVYVDFISVSKNDAIVITMGDGAVVCDISGGSSSLLYNGRKIAAGRGATEFDALVLTHYHEGHVRAVSAFVESNRVRRLYLPAPESAEDAAIMSLIADATAEEGARCFMYRADDVLTAFGDVEIIASGAKTPEGYRHPPVSLLVHRKEQGIMYASPSCEIKEGTNEALDALIIGSHGPRTKSDKAGALPSAKNLYLTDRALLEGVALSKGRASYGKMFVDCDVVSLIFE